MMYGMGDGQVPAVCRFLLIDLCYAMQSGVLFAKLPAKVNVHIEKRLDAYKLATWHNEGQPLV